MGSDNRKPHNGSREMSINELKAEANRIMGSKASGGADIAAEMSESQFAAGLKHGQQGKRQQGRSAAYKAGWAIGRRSLNLRDGASR